MAKSGKYLTAKIATTVIAGNYSWQAEEGGDVLDVTVGADQGHEHEEMGVDFTHVTVKGWFDIASGVYATIRRGTIISALNLFRDVAESTPAFAFSSALVTRSRRGGEVRGRIEFEFEAHAIGNAVTYDDPGV